MRLLILSDSAATAAGVLPALDLLPHSGQLRPAEPAALLAPPDSDVVLIDARRGLAAARALCRLLRATGVGSPLLAVFTEGGLPGFSIDWGLDDVILDTAGPAEVDVRLRLSLDRGRPAATGDGEAVAGTGLVIDRGSYNARLRGRVLDLTYKEFELLRYLAQHPGRVFTRQQLLQEVWGYDYYGGTRTIDVHVRRLRAKLGPEHQSLIGTVRQVGYKFLARPGRESAAAAFEADVRSLAPAAGTAGTGST